jgi:hypothetical protein
VSPHRNGGPTTATNGAGLCERGNYTKDMPGWTRHTTTSPDTNQTQVIEITTPTGHRYTTTPPPALGPGSNHHQQQRRRDTRRQDFLRRQKLIASLPSPDP